jgi:hypothetical protein
MRILILVLSVCSVSIVLGQGAKDTSKVNPPECGALFFETAKSNGKRFLSSRPAANQNDFGWMVLLEGQDGFKSGNLINSQWVLTNAENVEYARFVFRAYFSIIIEISCVKEKYEKRELERRWMIK